MFLLIIKIVIYAKINLSSTRSSKIYLSVSCPESIKESNPRSLVAVAVVVGALNELLNLLLRFADLSFLLNGSGTYPLKSRFKSKFPSSENFFSSDGFDCVSSDESGSASSKIGVAKYVSSLCCGRLEFRM